MQNVKFDAEIAKDPRFDNELQAIIAEDKEEIKKAEAKAPKGLKSNPLLVLLREGKFTVEFLKAEFPKISEKTSSLPSGQRDVIASIVFAAAKRTVLLKHAERAQKAAEKANARVEAEEAGEVLEEPKKKGSIRKLKKAVKKASK